MRNDAARRGTLVRAFVLGLPAVIAAIAADPATAAPSPILVSYGFDDGAIDTGPDTFAVFQHARGSVRLAREFRFSGYRSVEIRDVPGDGDFPELQGFFPERRTGWLIGHFVFMTTDPSEELNVALAGPAGFRLVKDGIALWLTVRDGHLVHISDGIPKRLLRLRAFSWYGVDVDYDIERGHYWLRIFEEGNTQPTVAVVDQPNAAAAPGSAVSLFSFIGDKGEDTSSATYYVDDILLGVDRDLDLPSFVAPGRRKLFVDLLGDYRKLATRRGTCLPLSDFADLGLEGAEVEQFRSDGRIEALHAALAGTARDVSGAYTASKLVSAADYAAGCAALERGEPASAAASFRQAADGTPEAPLYRLQYALALLEVGQLRRAERVLAESTPELRSDPRFAVATALLAARRGDEVSASAALLQPLDTAAESPGPAELLAEQYFFVLMWKEQWPVAREFAARRADRSKLDATMVSRWREREADAAFHAHDLGAAERLYRTAAAAGAADGDAARISLKLADVRFLLGDVAGERELREAIYGRLSEATGGRMAATPYRVDANAEYLDSVLSIVISATNAKQTLLAELAETGSLAAPLARYQAANASAQRVLSETTVPAALEPFRDRLSLALGLQAEFFAKAVTSRAAGHPFAEIWNVPEGRQASSLLIAAFRDLVQRLPELEPERRDLFYHRLCALDLY